LFERYFQYLLLFEEFTILVQVEAPSVPPFFLCFISFLLAKRPCRPRSAFFFVSNAIQPANEFVTFPKVSEIRQIFRSLAASRCFFVFGVFPFLVS